MGPKATPAKQGTLFSYFSKSPAVKPTQDKPQDILSPIRSPNQSKKNVATDQNKSSGKGIQKGDLLWAKLEGYPWWPSLVCDHPTANTHYKGGKTPQVHVQFFDTPISRSWIKEKNVKPFTGDDKDFQRGGPYYSTSPPVINGVEEAQEALKLSLEERLGLVVELQPSEDEEEDDEMDLDSDIFDAELSDENNESKENMDIEKKHSKKTPSKSPGKGRRPRRNQAKRRRIVLDDSDEEAGDNSEDEFKLDPKDKSDDDSCSSGVDENDVTSDSGSEPNSPIKLPSKRKKAQANPSWGPKTARRPPSKSLNSFAKVNDEEKEVMMSPKVSKTKAGENDDTVSSPKVSLSTKSKLASFTASDSVGNSTDSQDDKIVYQHLKYDWLQPDKMKDALCRRKTDIDYDPRTLYIPDQEKTKFTPAMRQWWEIKCQHFDTVLFFKMGKFYELFHMDAVIAVNELGLIYMKGDYAHSGFPEIAFGRYADTLVQKGYKVARIEQTETPDMMNERCKNMPGNPSKFDKVVKREVCRITTKGTKTFSFLSGECTNSESSFLLSLAEKETDTEGCSLYGVCFVDTSIGKFYIGQFKDDRHCSRLRTVLAHYPPVQILYERGKLTPKTNQLISTNLSSALKEALSPRTEFWDSSKTLRVLSEESYFKENDDSDVQWPDVIKKMISQNDALGRTAADEFSLAVSSLGALTWYLQFCLLDEELLSMKNFELYKPLDNLSENQEKRTAGHDFNNKHMVLDGVTLSNLDVTENSSTGTLEGTLLQRLDHCSTAFGKRLFRQWLCSPLCNPISIDDRLNAVEDLIGCQDIVADVIEIMKKLPDLERLLSRIHTLGTAKSKKNPESRAIFYEDLTYSKRKIEDFLATLEGFKTSTKIVKRFSGSITNFKSQLLKKTVGLKSDDGFFPNLSEDLKYFEQSFDHNKAKKDGVIIPNKGVDTDYDEAVSDMKSTENKLQAYLDKQRQRLGCRSIVYWGTAKNRYQMEIPETATRNVPNEYQLMSSKKGAKRYRTTEIEDLLAQMVDAEERKDVALKDVMRRIFHSFDERYKKWDSAVQCLSVLDVLLCLSQYSRCGDGPLCRPEIVTPSADQQPFLEIRDARHPCICKTFSGGDFIPNDTVIGVKDENDMETNDNQSNSQVVLVTGPNMGGKSTLMRQVGLVVIMAQMGCYVPAEKCRLTPVDRVFTRLGASDRIMSGESTFFVELSETSSILQHATSHSLVLVDELGRGTATYDGTAIACAVVQELSQNLRCRTLFSTHYHSLVEEFSHDPNIRLGHMACMVENEDNEDPSQETITFLYKFTSGACPKSYGFNAARLADLPEEVIKTAVQKSREFEESQNQIRHFKSIWKNPTKATVQSVKSVS